MIWIFNIVLYWTYLSNPAQYEVMVQQGQTCWTEASTAHLPTMGLGFTGDEPPACFYTPNK